LDIYLIKTISNGFSSVVMQTYHTLLEKTYYSPANMNDLNNMQNRHRFD